MVVYGLSVIYYKLRTIKKFYPFSKTSILKTYIDFFNFQDCVCTECIQVIFFVEYSYLQYTIEFTFRIN